MSGAPRQTGGRPDSKAPQRQPGWVVLIAVLAITCLTIGLLMLAMLQAPDVRRSVIATACAFVAAGVVFVGIAWSGRRRGAGGR